MFGRLLSDKVLIALGAVEFENALILRAEFEDGQIWMHI